MVDVQEENKKEGKRLKIVLLIALGVVGVFVLSAVFILWILERIVKGIGKGLR